MNATRTSSRIGLWLLLWGLLDLLCAMFCEIHADEAYYRLYGQFLNWGYFDHPPVVGLMTALSASMIHGTSLILKNLSVRLVTVLMHVGTVYIVWRTIDASRRKIGPFLLVAASIPMFCAYGFMTTPDAPLLFFTALFFYAYRRFLDEHSWAVTVLLGLSMAGMLYSKYIAVLVIVCVLLGNWRLLQDGKAWTAVGIAALMMLPHLWWQYTNNFPSFTYHLVSRATSYQVFYTLDFIPNQLAVFNPVVWALMLWFGARQIRHGDAFGRSAGMTIIGLQVFFLLMTVRGHVEPHWTIASSIPAIVLLTEEPTTWRKGVKIALGVCVGLVLVARVILMLNILPARTGLAHKQEFYETLHAEAEGKPVVFDGSFQAPSLYRFYYNDEAVLVRNAGDRYTQYDLLHLERELLGKPACVRRKGQVYMVDQLTEEDLHE
ncbi:MAG: glycosyltransferase family 39 protein [Paludibacteraceae bacterium]|nr:glycosyltransferase family 39 protein [Paludibacteraceae bacterium]